MLAHGNSHPMRCVWNLLNIIQLEAVYARKKGVDSRYIDKPVKAAVGDYQMNVEYLLKTYEPRVLFGGVDFKAINADQGDFKAAIKVAPRGGV